MAIFARWLLDPPKLAMPLLSAYAKAGGHSVKAVSFPFLPWRENELDEVLSLSPRVVGITTVAMFSVKYISGLVSWIREASPSSVIALGGHGAEFSEEIRKLGDVFISGHGEQGLADLVTAVKAGGRPADFPGASQGDGYVQIAGSLRYENMPVIRRADWSVSSTRSLTYPMEASRGCKFNCSYCNFPGHAGQTFRDPSDVVDEMKTLHRERGIRRFNFMDSSLTSDGDFIRALCRGIRETGIPFRWKCFARPDAFDRDPGLAEEMAAAGCRNIFMGIESIHDHILSLMRRGMDRACVERALDRVFRSGMKVHGNFITGFPGETEETVAETVRFVLARSFSSVYICVFMMTEAMRARAAAEPEKYHHLSGTPPAGWKHDFMDYGEARRLSRRAVLRINLSKMWPVAISLDSLEPDTAEAN